MSVEVWALVVLVLAALPLGLGVLNLGFYLPLPKPRGTAPALSVLIPARNEEERIVPVIESVLASRHEAFELIIGDDSSTDNTPQIVRDFASRDARVRLVDAPPLAEGWSGKQHACFSLSKHAAHDIAVFLDADVTVSPDALGRIASYMDKRPDVALLSGFPKQMTESFWEKLVIPLIHVLLLGYLPIVGARLSRHPMFGAACGQLVAVRMQAYRETGGHSEIADSAHDGVRLPRVFRRNGHLTALFDANALAATRMYDNLGGLWEGLAKNAHEGMATPIGLPIWTVLLAGGHILPLPLAIWVWVSGLTGTALTYLAVAAVCAYAWRAVLALRFGQSWLGVVFHPLAMTFFLVLQWTCLIRRAMGKSVTWRGRAYGSG